MKFLAGLNTTELRRLQPFLAYLVSEIEGLKSKGEKLDLVYGVDTDILPTANENTGGTLNKIARADHTHLFRFPTAVPTQLPPPDGASYFDTVLQAINVYISGSPTTKVVASAVLNDIQPTGRRSIGSAPRYTLADHSHATAILEETHNQTPVVNEIRYNENNKLVRWTGSSWQPLSVETASNALPNPAGGNSSAGTSTDFSKADHTHSVVLEPNGNLTSPADKQLGVWTALDSIGNLCLAIYHQNQQRWELPFARPLLSQASSVPSGKGFYTSNRSELAIRTAAFQQGVLYFRRHAETTWQPIGTVVQTSDQVIGITGELMRTDANISPSGQWYLRGRDNGGNVRALPMGIRTYTQSNKPTTNLPVNLGDAYGFFIEDRRLIELYPQQSDGIDRPVMLTGYHYNIPILPAEFIIGEGSNNIQITSVAGFPALRFYGSTTNSNLPYTKTVMHFLPMGVRRVRIGVLLQSGHPSGQFTYRFLFRIEGIETNSTAVPLATENTASFTMNPYAVDIYLSPPLLMSLPNTHSVFWGTPFAFVFQRRWDLETSNSHDLYVLGFVLIPVRE